MASPFPCHQLFQQKCIKKEKNYILQRKDSLDRQVASCYFFSNNTAYLKLLD